MEWNDLRSAAETITMPGDMKRRIAKNCKMQISKYEKESMMKRNTFFRKPAAVFVLLAICLSLAVTAVAAPEVLKGTFRDIKNWQGAVVGTAYDHATDEIHVNVTVSDDTLTVLAAFADPQMAPYRYAEALGIDAYRIVDASGRTVKEGSAETVRIINGRATISIPLDDISSGSYTLIVTSFVAEKKAEQPLPINGSWECAFTK